MRKIIIILMISVLGVSLRAFSSYAESSAAGKVEDRQTMINNVTDFFAAIGKDEEDAEEIVKERKDDRREARIKKKERGRKRAMKRQIKEQQAVIMEKIEAENAARYSK